MAFKIISSSKTFILKAVSQLLKGTHKWGLLIFLMGYALSNTSFNLHLTRENYAKSFGIPVDNIALSSQSMSCRKVQDGENPKILFDSQTGKNFLLSLVEDGGSKSYFACPIKSTRKEEKKGIKTTVATICTDCEAVKVMQNDRAIEDLGDISGALTDVSRKLGEQYQSGLSSGQSSDLAINSNANYEDIQDKKSLPDRNSTSDNSNRPIDFRSETGRSELGRSNGKVGSSDENVTEFSDSDTELGQTRRRRALYGPKKGSDWNDGNELSDTDFAVDNETKQDLIDRTAKEKFDKLVENCDDEKTRVVKCFGEAFVKIQKNLRGKISKKVIEQIYEHSISPKIRESAKSVKKLEDVQDLSDAVEDLHSSLKKEYSDVHKKLIDDTSEVVKDVVRTQQRAMLVDYSQKKELAKQVQAEGIRTNNPTRQMQGLQMEWQLDNNANQLMAPYPSAAMGIYNSLYQTTLGGLSSNSNLDSMDVSQMLNQFSLNTSSLIGGFYRDPMHYQLPGASFLTPASISSDYYGGGIPSSPFGGGFGGLSPTAGLLNMNISSSSSNSMYSPAINGLPNTNTYNYSGNGNSAAGLGIGPSIGSGFMGNINGNANAVGGGAPQGAYLGQQQAFAQNPVSNGNTTAANGGSGTMTFGNPQPVGTNNQGSNFQTGNGFIGNSNNQQNGINSLNNNNINFTPRMNRANQLNQQPSNQQMQQLPPSSMVPPANQQSGRASGRPGF